MQQPASNAIRKLLKQAYSYRSAILQCNNKAEKMRMKSLLYKQMYKIEKIKERFLK